jgi:predicted phage tail protein
MKTIVSDWSIEITQTNQKCKKLEHEKLLMKRDWSKTEWNLKGLLNNANKQVKDLEKKVSESNGQIKDIEKEFNDRRKEFNDLKLMKLETERNLKKSINEANKQIKDLEKEVNDIKQSTKIILDLKVGPADHGVKRPCIIPCKPKYLDKTNKANKRIKDLDDQTKSGLESKAGGAVKRKRKDYTININD